MVENLKGWPTTVVGRVCLDMLRARKSRREEALEGEPETVAQRDPGSDPEEEALLADAVGLALLVVETLPPAERLAFVLTTCGVPFEKIAPMVHRSEAATRQLGAARDGAAWQGGRPRPASSPASVRLWTLSWRHFQLPTSRACSPSWTPIWSLAPVSVTSRRRCGGGGRRGELGARRGHVRTRWAAHSAGAGQRRDRPLVAPRGACSGC